MKRWAAGLIIGTLVVCVGCVSLVYLLRIRVERSVATEMAHVVATQVVASISPSDVASGQLVLTAEDLDVNNTFVLGSCGFNTSTSGTQIFGIASEIDSEGIALVCGEVRYSAVPIVEGGRVELVDIEVSSKTFGRFFSKSRFEMVMEQGINNALEAKGLRPVGITLNAGAMTILTEETREEQV